VIAATCSLGDFDRHRIRASVQTRFSRERMADDYINTYLKVLAATHANRCA
jgi:hypothetical protein